jgi:beta-phosphoglucomutase-like phosphatase (HAD superfamily)
MAIGANLTKRDQMLISAIVLTVGLAGAYGYFMFIPKRQQLAAIEQHVDALDKKNQQAKADLASGSVAKLKAQAAEYEASLKALHLLCRVCSRTSRRPRVVLDSTSLLSSPCR